MTVPDLISKTTLLIGPPMSHAFFVANSLLNAAAPARILFVTPSVQDGCAWVHSYRAAYGDNAKLDYIDSPHVMVECSTFLKIVARMVGDADTIIARDFSRDPSPLNNTSPWTRWQKELGAVPNLRTLTIAATDHRPASAIVGLDLTPWDRVIRISDGHLRKDGLVREQVGVKVRLHVGSDEYLLQGKHHANTVTFSTISEPANV